MLETPWLGEHSQLSSYGLGEFEYESERAPILPKVRTNVTRMNPEVTLSGISSVGDSDVLKYLSNYSHRNRT